jgi:hypothetical protein
LNSFIKDPLIKTFEPLINNLDVFVILRVLHGIVAEVKALGLLNLSSHPLAEVGVVYAALSFLVFIDDKLCEVFEIEFFVFTAKVPQNIFDCHKAIIVAVKVQKGFANTRPVICKFNFD